MSLYSRYLLEKEGKFTLETEDGFVTFIIYPDNKEMYIDIMYVVPEKRKTRVASNLEKQVIEIAKENGCNMLTCVVASKHKNAALSLKAILAAGYEIHSTDSDKVILMKKIEGI